MQTSLSNTTTVLNSEDEPITLWNFYNPNSIRVELDCGTELITKQEFKAECDIHNILRQFSATGILDHVNQSQAQWTELPDTMDFQQSLAIIQEASDAFASLPSQVRDRYHNDPAAFLAALHDPKEHDKLVEYGVFKPPAPPPAPPAATLGANGGEGAAK